MNRKTKILEPDIAFVMGSREAVESAIDLAKDGIPWESRHNRITPWPAGREDDRHDCPTERNADEAAAR